MRNKDSKEVVMNKNGVSHAIQRNIDKVSYIFLTPMICFFIIFVLAPMVMGIFTSFFRYTMRDFSFSFLSNYTRMFADPVFRRSLWNTVVIVVTSVPLVTIFSLWAASAIYERNRSTTSFFRGVFYLPVVMGTVPVVVVWKWLFNPYFGLLNYVLKAIGVMAPNVRFDWLGEQSTAIWCILAILFTTSIGQPIVLYVAALGNVDKGIEEAAEVDGASRLRTFWQIKWPSIMPTTLYIVVITTINSFQCFALIQLLTSGGPSYSTSTVMYYLYEQAFTYYNYGYANAMGVILAVIIAFFSAIQFRVMRSEEA